MNAGGGNRKENPMKQTKRKVTVDQFIKWCNLLGISPGAAVRAMQKRMEAKNCELRCNDGGRNSAHYGDYRN